jgi:hypothetical protein
MNYIYTYTILYYTICLFSEVTNKRWRVWSKRRPIHLPLRAVLDTVVFMTTSEAFVWSEVLCCVVYAIRLYLCGLRGLRTSSLYLFSLKKTLTSGINMLLMRSLLLLWLCTYCDICPRWRLAFRLVICTVMMFIAAFLPSGRSIVLLLLLPFTYSFLIQCIGS